MEIITTHLPDVLTVIPKRFGDARGFFTETWNKKAWLEAGIGLDFVQDNHSLSASKGTLRGLHYQSPPYAQDKLVRTVAGSILDVAVDVRKSSPTFGQWVSVVLSAENGKQLLVPKGFLHGFLTLEENTEVVYKCTDYYAQECDGSVRFDDSALSIDWGVPHDELTLSEKDMSAQSFDDFDSPFNYEGLV
jgi:dTDP-4-dehydrorhamnose 3,5-epimerase